VRKTTETFSRSKVSRVFFEILFIMVLSSKNHSSKKHYLCPVFLNKYIKLTILFTFIFPNVFRCNAGSGNTIQSSTDKTRYSQIELLIDAKGVIEPAPEVCNGGVFLQNLYKLKNSFGSNDSFSVKQNASISFISYFYSLQSEIEKIPLFLFNRSIII
jgi:hypothetical protein